MSRRPAFVLLAVGLGATLFLAGCGGSSRPTPPPTHARSIGIGPVVLTAAQLAAESRRLHQPIFWAGLSAGYRYEFQRSRTGYIFVRYVPVGLPARTSGHYLIVATYPFPEAFSSLRQQARRVGARARQGPGGSIVFVDPKRPTSVRMAFPGVSAQVEIYDPRPVVALETAESGGISLVAG